MKTSCPNCNKSYNIPDAKIPKDKASVRCKKCNQIFEIKRPDDQPSIDTKVTEYKAKELSSPAVGQVESAPVDSSGQSAMEAPIQQEKRPLAISIPQNNYCNQNSCKTVQLVDYILDICKGRLNTKMFESNAAWLTNIGNLGLYLAALLGFVYATVYAIKIDAFSIFLAGLGWVLLVIIAQYTASKLLTTSESLIRSTPSQLSSTAFLDCLAVIFLILGILSLSYFGYLAIKIKDLDSFWIGLSCLITCEYLAMISMNPEMLNITISKNTNAGEEAIGLLSFLMKGLLKLVPIAFGTGIIVGSINLVIAISQLLTAEDFMVMGANIKAYLAASIIISSAALPFAAFVSFLIYYITIDILRAILVLPKKLELQSQTTKIE